MHAEGLEPPAAADLTPSHHDRPERPRLQGSRLRGPEVFPVILRQQSPKSRMLIPGKLWEFVWGPSTLAVRSLQSPVGLDRGDSRMR